MKKIYLDVDGVLLTSWYPHSVPGAEELIDYVTKHFDCYWLTSYCRGDAHYVLKLLSKYYDKETFGKLQTIKATDWQNQKTDAIDLQSDFYWLDDNPSRISIEKIKKHACLTSLIQLDVSRDNELKRALDYIKNEI